MYTRILLITTLLTLPTLALAQEAAPVVPMLQAPMVMAEQPAIPALPAITDNAQLDEAIRGLQNDWAVIKYRERNEDMQLSQMKKLASTAAAVEAQYPTYAEPKIWHAIILSTVAGMDGGLGALDLAKQAKALLEQAIRINPNALEGSAYTSLGTLYYKAPMWPIAFGDNGKARAYLEQARAINPHGIDPNYFYGDFLVGTDHANEAIPVLEHALQAAPRPGREVADSGRRQEVNEALLKAREEAAE
jgi:tetratricopeptide (TPR) repeat protein